LVTYMIDECFWYCLLDKAKICLKKLNLAGIGMHKNNNAEADIHLENKTKFESAISINKCHDKLQQ
jgi:hypothetical protein